MPSANIVSPTTYLAWTGGFGAAGLVLLLYGIYINLFILAIYTLSRQNKTAGKNVLLLACGTMFVLGTTQTILWVWSGAVNISILQELVDTGAHLDQADFVEKSLYRCYKIWGSRKMAVLLPATLILTTVGVTVASTVLLPRGTLDVLIRITFGLGVATNLVLMSLTGNSIDTPYCLWLKKLSGSDMVAAALESGALYGLCSIVLVIFGRNEDLGVYPIIAGASSQIMNIAPTLIMVRVGLGHNIQDSVSTVQTNDKWSRQVQAARPTSSWTVINIAPMEV
ncbi:hypothetical protein GGX14DRAFT_542332 [Mycena pura]|uniref:Uncharacterized protein n=1 Tax=Mycena pura TaxID=153505 RepID=A0AAD6VMA2_9AGAR|nr:hypothetical protein GGX14DRAFT_542332 [Mycena pura]